MTTYASKFSQPRVVLLLATLCCLLWGSAYPAIKLGYALLEIPREDVAAQLLFAGYRFVGAGLLLLFLAQASGKPVLQAGREHARTLVGLGIFQTTFQYVFFYVGLAHTTGIKASILNSLGAFFSVLIAHWLHHNDALTPRKAMGCLIGFAGVVVVNLHVDILMSGYIAGGAQTDWRSLLDLHWLGEGFLLMAALVLSAASIYGRKISQRMDSVIMTGYQLAAGGVVLVLMGLAGGGSLKTFDAGAWFLLFYLAALSATAFALWGVLLKHNRVSTVSVYYFLIPIFGAVLSAVFLGESLAEWKYLVALILVCIGIYAVNREKPS